MAPVTHHFGDVMAAARATKQFEDSKQTGKKPQKPPIKPREQPLPMKTSSGANKLPDDDDLTVDEDDMDIGDAPIFMVTVLEIQAVELRTVHKFGKNNPCVKLLCDNFYKVTNINTDGTDICFWKNLNWSFPANDESTLKLSSTSILNTVLGETTADIGIASIKCSQLKSIPRNRMGHREVVMSLVQGGIYSGKIRMIVRLRAGDEDEPSPKKPGSAGFGRSERVVVNGVEAGVGKKDDVSVSVAPSKVSRFSKMNQSAVMTMTDNFSEPCKITIKAISVIDLASVHTFSSNSPCVNLACGKFQARTPEKEGAGHHASWDILDLSFYFDKRSVLRVLITSKMTNIGLCNIKRNKMLSAKKNKTGLYTIFAELEKSPGVPAGKLKVQYNMVLPTQ